MVESYLNCRGFLRKTRSIREILSSLFLLLAILAMLEADDIQYYTVRKGDTLYSLARSYSVPLEEIMRINGLKSSTALRPGMLLKIPSLPGQSGDNYANHTVTRGETYYSIAQKYLMSVDALLQLNGLSVHSVLRPGQDLIVQKLDLLPEESLPPSTSSAHPAAKEDFYWPVAGRREILAGKLEGVRILASDQSLVYAIAGGTVMWQGPYRSYGTVALIASSAGYVYLYGGNLHFLINTGQEIRRGDPIAQVDSKVKNQLAGQSQIYQGDNKELTLAKRNPGQVYFSVFHNGEFVAAENAPRG